MFNTPDGCPDIWNDTGEVFCLECGGNCYLDEFNRPPLVCEQCGHIAEEDDNE